MKTLQEQFNLINEGKGHKDVFLKSARRLFPEYITNFATYNEAVKILKQKSILNEAIGGVVTQRAFDPFQTFNTFLSEEAKAVEKKPTKDIVEKETTGFDYKNTENIDKFYGTSFLQGFYAEMQDPKNAEKTVDELKQIVAKNMAKDTNYYMKNAAFGIKGIGYKPLKEPKAPTGKYKSSGYGDLKENKENKPENPYSLYTDHPKFKEAEQAIAKALKTATKWEDVENILKKYREAGADETDSRTAIKKVFNNDFEQKIDWIKYEVDYVPDDEEVYKKWPEPYRSRALKALEYRKKNFNTMSKEKLDSLNESKLRSLVHNLIKEELN